MTSSDGLAQVVESDSLTNETKLSFLQSTRHAYGRSALLLSGGATMGLFHLGMVKTLWEQKLLPRIISGASPASSPLRYCAKSLRLNEGGTSQPRLESYLVFAREGLACGAADDATLDIGRSDATALDRAGASAGSIVAAMVACKTEEAMGPMFDPYAYDNFDMLGTVEELTTDTSPTFARLKNILAKGVLFDSDVLKKFLRSQVGDLTFQEAFELTGRVLNITGACRACSPSFKFSRQWCQRARNRRGWPSVLSLAMSVFSIEDDLVASKRTIWQRHAHRPASPQPTEGAWLDSALFKPSERSPRDFFSAGCESVAMERRVRGF
jgi:hypothetical protein